VIHANETPWKQNGRLRWLWGVLSSSTAIRHIGSRSADEIRDLISEAARKLSGIRYRAAPEPGSAPSRFAR
jgi:hypothetical protein